MYRQFSYSSAETFKSRRTKVEVVRYDLPTVKEEVSFIRLSIEFITLI